MNRSAKSGTGGSDGAVPYDWTPQSSFAIKRVRICPIPCAHWKHLEMKSKMPECLQGTIGSICLAVQRGKNFWTPGPRFQASTKSRWTTVQKIRRGDYLLCYLTGVSRFIGVLEVQSEPYKDT